jgi:hypothetical protein
LCCVIREVFHLDKAFMCWFFRVIRVLLKVGGRDMESAYPATVDVQALSEAF